jgi:hypothetical protein
MVPKRGQASAAGPSSKRKECCRTVDGIACKRRDNLRAITLSKSICYCAAWPEERDVLVVGNYLCKRCIKKLANAPTDVSITIPPDIPYNNADDSMNLGPSIMNISNDGGFAESSPFELDLSSSLLSLSSASNTSVSRASRSRELVSLSFNADSAQLMASAATFVGEFRDASQLFELLPPEHMFSGVESIPEAMEYLHRTQQYSSLSFMSRLSDDLKVEFLGTVVDTATHQLNSCIQTRLSLLKRAENAGDKQFLRRLEGEVLVPLHFKPFY